MTFTSIPKKPAWRSSIQYCVQEVVRRAGLDVIFNFSRYEELRQAVMQLVRENLDPDLLQEEAHDLFESWWASTHSQGQWNAEVKQRTWDSIWREFGNGPKR